MQYKVYKVTKFEVENFIRYVASISARIVAVKTKRDGFHFCISYAK